MILLRIKISEKLSQIKIILGKTLTIRETFLTPLRISSKKQNVYSTSSTALKRNATIFLLLPTIGYVHYVLELQHAQKFYLVYVSDIQYVEV